jgi:hypothetical protein
MRSEAIFCGVDQVSAERVFAEQTLQHGCFMQHFCATLLGNTIQFYVLRLMFWKHLVIIIIVYDFNM